MVFVEITPELAVSSFAKADGFWLDWDKGSVEGNQRFLESIAEGRIEGLDPAPFGDRPFCVLEEELRAIPQELLNDPRLEGILFVEKSHVRRNYDGSYDVAKLFEGILYDKAFEMEDRPKAENWELDYQGYLVREDMHDEGSKPENSSESNPYAVALNFLDPTLRFPRS
jgi:hypothetical protein